MPAARPSPPRKATLSSRLAATLAEAILAGEVLPGAKLNLDALRARFRVSASPLREAMARLAAEGLVTFEDQRGYHVAPVSPGDRAELAELRLALETLALRRAIALGDLEWEGAVMGALYRLARTDPADAPAWAEAHRRFHLALAEGAGMPRLLGLCGTLLALADRYRRLPGARPEGPAAAARHAAIAEAAVAREAEAAAAALAADLAQEDGPAGDIPRSPGAAGPPPAGPP